MGQPEAWLRGPVPGVPPLLMPAAHALQQASEDLERVAADLDPALVWARPGGAASIGFHLRHVAGVIDRLLTYARGEALSDAQLRGLAEEGEPGDPPASAGVLLEEVRAAVERALAPLQATDPATLLGPVANKELKRVAQDATARMLRVRGTLEGLA